VIVELGRVVWNHNGFGSLVLLLIRVPEMYRPVAASSATPRGGLPNDSEEDSVVTLDQVPRWIDAEHSLENDNIDPLAFQSGTGGGPGGSVSRFPVDHEINSRIYLWRGDPWNLEVDAVVNSTNEARFIIVVLLSIFSLRLCCASKTGPTRVM
ncbi:hypothetical protein L195_g044114, partial [Trifolium pratense]